MHFTAAAAAAVLAFAASASAHATMSNVWVNGEDQGEGRDVYIRSPSNNSPVKDLSSPDLICGDRGDTPVKSFVRAAPGDTLSFKWFHNEPNPDDDVIADSHKGPILTYIARYTEGAGTGPIWTKIAEDGYDPVTKKWAVDKLIAAGGLNDFDLPADLAPGKYLIRQEIIALHEADGSFSNSERGAQFYPSCAQVEVSGSGTAVPAQGFDINTGYTYSDPGIFFDLYTSYDGYEIPGPEVYAGAGSVPKTGSGSDSGNSDQPAVDPVASPAPAPSPAAPVPDADAPDADTPAPRPCPGRGRRD